MRRPLKHPRIPLDVLLGTLLAGVIVGGGAVVGVGLFDVSARAGHWPFVSWVLHTAYERSVELRSPPAATVPRLDDEALVALGAAHFEGACSHCHAAPGRERDPTVLAMVPQPPHVSDAVEGWDAENLFWILKHGVKMSGMPHWPSLARDDGIWAVVAFLERAEGLDAAGYETLLAAQTGAEEASAPVGTASQGTSTSVSEETTLAGCARCHGFDGASGGNTHIPRLDLLEEDYIAASLAAYRDDERFSGIMQHAAGTLADEEIAQLARRYASVGEDGRDAVDVREEEGARENPDGESAGAEREAMIARGAALATGAGTAKERREVPVCAACHGPWPTPQNERYPSIAGQHEGYLLAQLQAWRAGNRGGTPLARMMHEVAPALGEEDLSALAAYYATLPIGFETRTGKPGSVP